MSEHTTGYTATQVEPWPGANTMGSIAPPGWHTKEEAARLVGRSKDTLKRWMQDGTYEPGGFIQRGKLTIWLWSDADIERMRDIAKTKRSGRPRANKNNNNEGQENGTDNRGAADL